MHNLLILLMTDFFIQIVGFILAFSFQTEKFYDLTGSFTFLLLAHLSLRWKVHRNWRQILLTTLVTLWALRLGTFLVYRVLKEGGDRRFTKVKTKPTVFFIYWMVQGVWIFVTLLPVLMVNTSNRNKPLNIVDYVGTGVWLTGFLFEVIADWQKLMFRSNHANTDKFISEGLWSVSRHPNYFGEILLWVGIFIVASSALSGWQWVCIISPLFVYYLLNYVSGIPILERSGLKRYGELPEYKRYLNTVPILVPFVGRT